MRAISNFMSLTFLGLFVGLGYSFYAQGPEKSGYELGSFIHNISKGLKGEPFETSSQTNRE